MVAALAVSVAVVGTAIANPDAITSKLTKSKVKKIAKKQANKRINKREPKLSVKSAETAGSASSATTAQSATRANSAASADSFGGLRPTRIPAFTLTNGQSRQVGVFGPFTLTATCEINAVNVDSAVVGITTNQNNSAFRGEDEDADFDVGENLEFVAASITPTGTPDFQEDGGVAIAPNGFELIGYRLYAGVNVLNQAGTCRFGGAVFTG